VVKALLETINTSNLFMRTKGTTYEMDKLIIRQLLEMREHDRSLILKFYLEMIRLK
jgi:hypothetical protein